MKTTRRTILGHLLLPVAAAAAVTAAPHAAHAQVAAAVGEMLVKTTLEVALGYGADYAMAELFGSTSSPPAVDLSSASLAEIQSIVSDELAAAQLTTYQNRMKTLLSNVAGYARGTTPTDLANAQSMAYDLWNEANELHNDFSSAGAAGGAPYAIAASIYVTFLKEEHDIKKLRGGTSQTVLDAAVAHIVAESDSIVADLDVLSAEFGALYSNVYLKTPTYSGGYVSQCPMNVGVMHIGSTGDAAYCFTGPDGEVCGSSFPAYACDEDRSTWNYDATLAARSLTEASVKLQQQKIAKRDTLLGGAFFEGREAFQKVADGNVASCGDGACAIGELDSCAADCAGRAAVLGATSCGDGVCGVGEPDTCAADCAASGAPVGAFSYTRSQARAILTGAEAQLEWSSAGDLALYDTTVSPRQLLWKTGTAGDTVTFQDDGNLVIYNAGAPLWSANTGSRGASEMVIVDKVLYLVDAHAKVLWSSDRDWNIRAELPARFCYGTSQAMTLLSNSKARLDWQSDGNLVVYTGGNATWDTETGGKGAWLCHQEDGNLVIYSDTGAAVWAADAHSGAAGDLVLQGDQLRLTTAGGQPYWRSPACSTWSCASDPEIASIPQGSGTCYTTSQATTLLHTAESDLVWQGDGNLVLYDNTVSPRKAAWASATSGASNELCYQGDGNLVIYNGSNVKWASSNAGAGKPVEMVLAGCSFYMDDASTGRGFFRTNTTCASY